MTRRPKIKLEPRHAGASNASQHRNPVPQRHQIKPPTPKVLQRKSVSPQTQPLQNAPKTPAAPAVYRPNAMPKVLQSKMANGRPKTAERNVAQRVANVKQPAKEQSVVQPFTSRVVQAVKIYPNLHPGAVEPVDHGNVFRLNSFANQYRLQRVNSHSVNVPNQQYNFVRTREGEMLLHARYRHPSIAEGKQVLYAGEIFFNNGQLEWWSNGSGHYQPYVEDAEQANLPMDQFYSYQQVIKGEHKRKKG